MDLHFGMDHSCRSAMLALDCHESCPNHVLGYFYNVFPVESLLVLPAFFLISGSEVVAVAKYVCHNRRLC